MILHHKEHGMVDAASSGYSVEALKNMGWFIQEHVTIEPVREAVKGKPGRKPKNLSLGGNNGNNSKQD